MEHVDKRRALELLIDVVEAYGENTTYETVPLTLGGTRVPGSGNACRYQYLGHPSCLIGHALFRAGATMTSLEMLDRHGASARAIPDRAYNLDVSEDASRVFQAAQNVQDGGDTWGAALENARRKYKLLVEKGNR